MSVRKSEKALAWHNLSLETEVGEDVGDGDGGNTGDVDVVVDEVDAGVCGRLYGLGWTALGAAAVATCLEEHCCRQRVLRSARGAMNARGTVAVAMCRESILSSAKAIKIIKCSKDNR